MVRPGSLALTALLALFTAIGPVSIDLYVPALPEVGLALDASDAAVQLTISMFLIGFASGQLVHGPASDRFGRRPVLMVALAIFCLGALICTVAPSIGILIAARFVQGFGASGAITLARAVIRDLYEGSRAARELSLMAMIMGLAPIVGPLIGGGLQSVFGWRADFVFILVAGTIAAAMAFLLLPETRRRDSAAPHRPADVLASFATVARHRVFFINIALASLSFAGLFAWISGSPFVLQNLYGQSPLAYSGSFALSACGFIAGTSIAVRIVERVGLDRTMGIGATLLATAGLLLVLAAAALPRIGLTLVLPIALYLAGMGMVMPQAFAASLQPFPERAGVASSLGGVTQQTAAAATGIFVGHMLGGSAWPLVIPIAVAGWLTLAVWWLSRDTRRKG